MNKYEIEVVSTYVAFCIAFIAAAPVLNASTVSVVAFAPSNIIILSSKKIKTWSENDSAKETRKHIMENH